MAKYSLKITPLANADLESIFSYTVEQWGFTQAKAYHNLIHNGFQKIAERPEVGVPFETKKYNYRFIRVKKHLIYYRTYNEQILIVRILHGKVLRKKFLE